MLRSFYRSSFILVALLLLSLSAPAVYADSSVNGYPIIPSISGSVYRHARQLVRAGKKQGNRIDVFSKVGDSITATPYFLYAVGNGGLRLGSYSNLQATVNFFTKTQARNNNSFANDSLAAHGQWSTRDVLNPANADHGVCAPDQSPLDCELSLTKPSVALILFGANDVQGIPIDEFRANLERIVQITEGHGVIPVLSTTPNRLDDPKSTARIDSYNAVIAQVARAHADPLWNFWKATIKLTNSGLASNDNIHPSIPDDHNTAIFDAAHLTYGAPIRNLTALQVLDVLRQTVLK